MVWKFTRWQTSRDIHGPTKISDNMQFYVVYRSTGTKSASKPHLSAIIELCRGIRRRSIGQKLRERIGLVRWHWEDVAKTTYRAARTSTQLWKRVSPTKATMWGSGVDVDVPPLKMTVSHALSGSLTVLVGTICVAPTAVTNGQTTGNLLTSRINLSSAHVVI